MMRRIWDVNRQERVAQILRDACGEPRVGVSVNKENVASLLQVEVSGHPMLVRRETEDLLAVGFLRLKVIDGALRHGEDGAVAVEVGHCQLVAG